MCDQEMHEVQEILPDSAAAEKRKESSNRRILIITVLVLLASVAIAVLAAYVWFPVLQVYGKSMTPTLTEGDYVVVLKTTKARQGDIVALDVNNKLLIRRVIGVSGDEVNVAADGTVTVNGNVLEEPYAAKKHDGAPDVTMPCTVPEGAYFLMGDEREKAVDSRHGAVGCVTEDQIIGKLILRIWPMSGFGTVK